MNDIANDYLALYIFFAIVFLLITSLFYFLYWSYKKGVIWDGGGDEVGGISRKVRREDDPEEFWRLWRDYVIFFVIASLVMIFMVVFIYLGIFY